MRHVISNLKDDPAYNQVLSDSKNDLFVHESLRSITGEYKRNFMIQRIFRQPAMVSFERGSPVLSAYNLINSGARLLVMCHTNTEHPSNDAPVHTPEHDLYASTTATHALDSSKFRKIYKLFAVTRRYKNVSTFIPHVIFFKDNAFNPVESRIAHVALVSSHLDHPRYIRTRLNCVFDIALRTRVNDMHCVDTIILSDLNTQHPDEYAEAFSELYHTYKYHFKEIRIVSDNDKLVEAFQDLTL